eukprot:1989336-Pyramimonas_sp.AAC.1
MLADRIGHADWAPDDRAVCRLIVLEAVHDEPAPRRVPVRRLPHTCDLFLDHPRSASWRAITLWLLSATASSASCVLSDRVEAALVAVYRTVPEGPPISDVDDAAVREGQ